MSIPRMHYGEVPTSKPSPKALWKLLQLILNDDKILIVYANRSLYYDKCLTLDDFVILCSPTYILLVRLNLSVYDISFAV